MRALRNGSSTTTVQKKMLGGEPVQFKPQEGVVLIAGDSLTFEEWEGMRDTIDRMFERIGKKKPQGALIVPFDPAPWWLRLFGVGGTVSTAQVPKGYMK